MRGRHRKLLPLLAITLAALACTTVSNEFLQDVGTTILFLTDADLKRQDLEDPEGTIQAARWVLTQADLEIEGYDEIGDMLFGEQEICIFTDSAVVSPISEGRCSSGIVLGATTEDAPVNVTLTLTFSMTVQRAVPPERTGPFENYDNDAWRNEVDNCPFLPNDDQEDTDTDDGRGDACTYVDPQTGFAALDSDGDGVPDSFDNCVWEPNPSQTDSQGIGADGIADAIGDACAEESAAVEMNGSREITITLGPVPLTQLRFQIAYLTIDFESDQSLAACWDDGVCELNEAAVKLCVNENPVAALSGCF